MVHLFSSLFDFDLSFEISLVFSFLFSPLHLLHDVHLFAGIYVLGQLADLLQLIILYVFKVVFESFSCVLHCGQVPLRISFTVAHMHMLSQIKWRGLLELLPEIILLILALWIAGQFTIPIRHRVKSLIRSIGLRSFLFVDNGSQSSHWPKFLIRLQSLTCVGPIEWLECIWVVKYSAWFLQEIS